MILGTMLGGYNIQPLIQCLEDDELVKKRAMLEHNLINL